MFKYRFSYYTNMYMKLYMNMNMVSEIWRQGKSISTVDGDPPHCRFSL